MSVSSPRTALIEGPIARTLFFFTLPILASNVLQSLNGSVNAIWVGHYLGEAALTATSNADTILFFPPALVFGVGMAATILVFGVGPIPRMGIAGSALATLIAQVVSLVALLVHLYRAKHFLWLHGAELRYLRPDGRLLRALVYKGLPMGLQMIVLVGSPNASPATASASTPMHACITRRRSKRSATCPDTSTSTKAGRNCTRPTRPRSSARPVMA